MNYAEDRLDRRSRHSGVDNLSPLEIDLKQAHKYIRESTSISSRWKGHELAGRTLRDAGLSPQASFHYAMAWILSHSLNDGDLNDSRKDKAVGDYAQMAELAGFPEVAVLSLLFHLNGGMLDIVAKQEEICEQKIGEEIIFAVDGMDRFKLNCGCGLSKCGASDWCYIPPQVHCSIIYRNILDAFGDLEISLKIQAHQEGSSAADLLEAVTKATQKKNPILIDQKTHRTFLHR